MVSNAATSLFVMIKSKFAHPSCCLANIFSNTGHRYHAHPAETRTQSFITIDFQRLIVPCETASMRDISRRLARISRSFFDGSAACRWSKMQPSSVNSWYLDFTFQEIAQLGTYPFLEIAQPAPFFDWRVPGDGPVSLSNHNENMEVGFIE